MIAANGNSARAAIASGAVGIDVNPTLADHRVSLEGMGGDEALERRFASSTYRG